MFLIPRMSFFLKPFEYLLPSQKVKETKSKLDCGTVKVLLAGDTQNPHEKNLFRHIQAICKYDNDSRDISSEDCATIRLKLKHIKVPNLLEALLLRVSNEEYFNLDTQANNVLGGDVVVICLPLGCRS